MISPLSRQSLFCSSSAAAHDSCAPTLWLEEQANDQGWSSFNARPRALGDANGDGRADIVGFAPDGTYVTAFDRQTRFVYDDAGNLLRQQDARGLVTFMYYDALNRLTGKDYCNSNCPQTPPASPTLDVQYVYDCTSTGYGIGYLHYSEDLTTNVKRSLRYDQRGRVDGAWLSVGGTDQFRTSWSYNALDQVLTQSYPGGNSYNWGETVTTGYDSFARPYSLSGTSTYVSSVTYDSYGHIDVVTFGNSYLTDHAYYGPNQKGGRLAVILTGITGDLAKTQYLYYNYDNVGNISWIRDAKNSYQYMYYGYDDLGRLTTGYTNSSGADQYNHSYAYDSIGNLTSYAGATLAYTDTLHVHAVTKWDNEIRYAYDANGNMTSRKWNGATQTLTYDAENRLTGVSGSGTGSFVYDGEGKRVKGTVNGATTCYMGDWYEWNGTAGTSYYYLGGRRVALRTASGDVSYIHGDHLSSATNTTGAITSTQRYYPYGTQRGSNEVATPYRYTGQREESGIGLYFYNARWYDPYVGRFIQPDTIVPEPGNPQAYNRYTYVLNNPVRYSDPSGLRNEPTTGGGVGGKPKAIAPMPYPAPAPLMGPRRTPTPAPWQRFTPEEMVWLGSTGVSADPRLLAAYQEVKALTWHLLPWVGEGRYDYTVGSLCALSAQAVRQGPDSTLLVYGGLMLPGANAWTASDAIILPADYREKLSSEQTRYYMATLNHEYVHVLQVRRDGKGIFYRLYAGAWVLAGIETALTGEKVTVWDKSPYERDVAIPVGEIYDAHPGLPNLWEFPGR